MVRKAGAAADDALESLCSAYRIPLSAYVRRHGFSKKDAEDLIQAFLAKLLERQDFAALNQENWRFRAFLLTVSKHFFGRRNSWEKYSWQRDFKR